MPSKKVTSKRPRKRKRKQGRTSSAGGGNDQVFPFRLIVDEPDDILVDPRTRDRAKDKAIRVAWKYLKQFSTFHLVTFLPLIAKYGDSSDEQHEIELDSGDETRDVLLEEIWSWLRNWDVVTLIGCLPTIIEVGLEDSGKPLAKSSGKKDPA